MTVIHQIKMDFTKRGVLVCIDAVQGDSYTRMLEISLYENGVAWPVPEGASVLLRFRKPDGTGGLYDTLPDGTEAWSAEENVICFTLAPQVLAVPGLVQAQLEIVEDSTALATFTFQIVVERDPSDGAVASEDYFNWNAWAEKALEDALGSGGMTDERIADAVAAYLEENPVEGGGTDGEDGGYYTPYVTQPDENTMQVSFAPSRSDMPSVEDAQIILPVGIGDSTELSKVANLHVWRETPVVVQIVLGDAETVDLCVWVSYSSDISVSYADNLEIIDGVAVLSNVQTISYTRSGDGNDYGVLLGKYVENHYGDIYYIPDDADISMINRTAATTTTTTVQCYSAQAVSVVESEGEFGYVSDASREAFPDDVEQDGYQYTYLGRLGDGLIEGGGSGTNGVGISSVEQTTTSTADDGTNIITVTLTDGTTSEFRVKNGSGGAAGADGKDGFSIYAVHLSAGDATELRVAADSVETQDRALQIGDLFLTEDRKIFVTDMIYVSTSSSGEESSSFGASLFADLGDSLTMSQVNQAIETAITGAIGGSY